MLLLVEEAGRFAAIHPVRLVVTQAGGIFVLFYQGAFVRLIVRFPQRRVDCPAGHHPIEHDFAPVEWVDFQQVPPDGICQDHCGFLSAGSHAYGIGPALTLPIFEGGKLRANLRGQTAAADAAIARYNATLVNAVREVADALSDRRSLEQQIGEQQQALKLARQAHGLVQSRYGAGLGNYLDVLSSDDAVLQQELAGAGLKARALIDDVALIRALGGGYAAGPLPALPASASSAVAARP